MNHFFLEAFEMTLGGAGPSRQDEDDGDQELEEEDEVLDLLVLSFVIPFAHQLHGQLENQPFWWFSYCKQWFSCFFHVCLHIYFPIGFAGCFIGTLCQGQASDEKDEASFFADGGQIWCQNASEKATFHQIVFSGKHAFSSKLIKLESHPIWKWSKLAKLAKLASSPGWWGGWRAWRQQLGRWDNCRNSCFPIGPFLQLWREISLPVLF